MNVTQALPELPYDKRALHPVITEKTFDYHYGKHHAAYVNNLAALVKDTPLAEASVEQLIQQAFASNDAPLFNNAAQHWNHSFFWHCRSPDGGKAPSGKIAALLERDFGSFEQFKNKFSETAIKLFGCGWAWLAQNERQELEIVSLKDAHTPLTTNKTPILTLYV